MGILTLRVNDDLAGRVEAVVGRRGRSKFIRDAIEAALVAAGHPAPKRPKVEKKAAAVEEYREKVADIRSGKEPVAPLSPKPGRWDADKEAIGAELGKGPGLVRKLSERLGWAVPRTERVADMLIEEGRVTASGGLLEAADV